MAKGEGEVVEGETSDLKSGPMDQKKTRTGLDWTGLDRFFNWTMVAVALNLSGKDWLQLKHGQKKRPPKTGLQPVATRTRSYRQ